MIDGGEEESENKANRQGRGVLSSVILGQLNIPISPSNYMYTPNIFISKHVLPNNLIDLSIPKWVQTR